MTNAITGSPAAIARCKAVIEAAITERTDAGCWLAPTLGPFRIAGRILTPARAAWLAAHGEVTGNVYRLCKSRACVNPEHLTAELGCNRGRRRRGWTAADVAAIKHNLGLLQDAGFTQINAAKALGAHFGIAANYVLAIANGSALRDLQSAVDPFEPGKLARVEPRAVTLGEQLRADPGNAAEYP